MMEKKGYNYKGSVDTAAVLFEGLLTGKDDSIVAVQVPTRELPNGGKLPTLILVCSATQKGDSILIEHLAYMNAFKKDKATVPVDFKFKRLLGTMSHKMVDKYAEHLKKVKEQAELKLQQELLKQKQEEERQAKLIEEMKSWKDWEVVLNVMCPNIKRPRRTSLHTLATVLGRKDPLELAKEMQESGKVVGYVCPDVKTPIFYLISLCRHPGMIDTRDASIWGKLPDFFKNNPYPEVKGFKRFAQGSWAGGSFGKGKFTPANTAMNVPYEADDYPYARLVIKTLKAAGFTPGIEDPEKVLVEPQKVA